MNFKILFFLMMISISCTDGQENVVKSPELQTEVPNSNSDSNSTEETSGNTSENSNSDSDSSTESNSTNDDYETTTNMNQTYFIDEEIGFIAGDGVVLKTNNGGQTWTSIKEDKNIKFRSIHFENKSIGLVGGNDGFYSYVYLTNNGGLTWEQILRVWYSNESNEVINLFGNKNSRNIILFVNQYPNSTQAYGHVYVSKNAGEDWNELDKVTIGRPGISSAFKLNDKIYFMSKSSWTGSTWATSFYESYFLDEQSLSLIHI